MKTLIHFVVLFLLVLAAPYWVGSGGDPVEESLPH